MRPALVDNLTLSAVQRLLGQVVAEYYDEGEEMAKDDVIAFDNLLNAVLFSDEVVYIEGFMPQNGDADRFGEYFPRFRQCRMGIVAYRTIIKDINNEFALKYDKNIEDTPAFFAYEFMKPHVQLPALDRLEYGTLVYHTISANMGADLVLFPSRSTFQRRLLRDFTKELSTGYFKKPSYIRYNSPMFISWFAKTFKDPSRFIDEAYELRKRNEFAEIRETLDELRNICENPGITTFIQKKLAEKALFRKMDRLLAKYQVNTDRGPTERVITVAFNLKSVNQGFIPAHGLEIEKEEEAAELPKMQSLYDVKPRQGHVIYLGDPDRDRRQMEKLGILYDYITADMIFKNSHQAKVFNEAVLINTLKDNNREAREIFAATVSDALASPLEIIDHSDLVLSEETVKILQEMKKD